MTAAKTQSISGSMAAAPEQNVSATEQAKLDGTTCKGVYCMG